jgi:thymidylate synthase
MEMIKEVERDLFEMGIKYQSSTVQDMNVGEDEKFQTLELFGYAYTLKNYSDKDLDKMLKYTDSNIEWVKAESEERLDSDYRSWMDSNPGKAWEVNKKAKDFWKKFLRDGMFSYSYSERWQWQLPYIINELKLRPNSRQAIMTMYSAERDIMNWGGRDRVPCSLTYHFVIREDQLKLIYNQRSCDFLNFFASDVYQGVRLLQFVADMVDVEPGDFIHYLNSLHAFKGDMDQRNIF